MKRKPLLAGTAVLVMVLLFGVSIAYFTSADTDEGSFRFGSVEVELSEPAWDPGADHIIKDDASFDKDPQVKNTGTSEAYVRVHVTISDYDAIKQLIGEEPETLLVSETGEPIDETLWKQEGEPLVADDQVTYTYVYQNPLPVGETTPPVFEKVVFAIPDGVAPESIQDVGDNFLITVTADAVQTSTFGSPEEAFEALDGAGN